MSHAKILAIPLSICSAIISYIIIYHVKCNSRNLLVYRMPKNVNKTPHSSISWKKGDIDKSMVWLDNIMCSNALSFEKRMHI